MLRLRRALAQHIEIPFRFTFRHALAERSRGEGVLVQAEDAEGRVGFGECAPRSYVSGETVESVRAALPELWSKLAGSELGSFEELCAALEDASADLPRERHAAFCTLELALLDLGGRCFGSSAGDVAGPVVREALAYSGIVSADTPETAERTCAMIAKLGVQAVKVKVGRDLAEDRALLAVVRRVLGEGVSLRVDANGAWDARTGLERIRALSEFDLHGVEQPVAAGDLDGMAWLTERSSVPVIADESLVSLEDAHALAERRGCHVFNVRISKCGGLLRSAAIRDVGRAAGIGCMLGAQVGETAILSAAGRQFGARTPELSFAEGSYGTLLLERDVSDDLTLEPGGVGRVPRGVGLGVRVNADSVREFVREEWELE